MFNEFRNIVNVLTWDTEFFGYPVARVNTADCSGAVFKAIMEEIGEKKIKLTYFFVAPSDLKINEAVTKAGGILVDQKTVFVKNPLPQTDFKNVITDFIEETPDEKLIKLVLEAGLFSRYKLDKRFVNREYERLYTEWLYKSLKKESDTRTLVTMSDNSYTGLITIGRKEDYADIGLVAVDSSYRGMGIGTDLIRYADNLAFEMQFSRIKVVTQLQNQAACRLYEKCDFKIDSITNIYHFWQ